MNKEVNNNVSTTIEKKKVVNMFMIIVPIVVVVIIVFTVYMIFFNKDKVYSNDVLDNTNEHPDNGSINESEIVGWDDYSLIIDGKEIKLPLKVSDFLDMGFYEMDTYHDTVLTENVFANERNFTRNSNISDTYGLFTNGTTSLIALNVYNNSNETKKIKDCYIFGITFQIDEETEYYKKIGEVKVINNTKNVTVIMGETKYEDVMSVYSQHIIDNSTYINHTPDTYITGVDDFNYFGSWLNMRMNFNEDTRIFEPDFFSYYDIGNIKKSSVQ